MSTTTEKNRPTLAIIIKKRTRKKLQGTFITTLKSDTDRYNFVCHQQEKNKPLEHFYENLFKFTSRAGCGHCKKEWVWTTMRPTKSTTMNLLCKGQKIQTQGGQNEFC